MLSDDQKKEQVDKATDKVGSNLSSAAIEPDPAIILLFRCPVTATATTMA